jgi:hypothetical protein
VTTIGRKLLLGLLAFALHSIGSGCAASAPGTCNDECWNDDNCQSGLACVPTVERWVCMPAACMRCSSSTPVCNYSKSTTGCSFVGCSR